MAIKRNEPSNSFPPSSHMNQEKLNMTKTIHYSDNPNNFYLQCHLSLDQILSLSNRGNNQKKPFTFDSKYQIFLIKNFRQCSIGINQAVSMLNLRAASKFLSDLISYLSGKKIIAVSKICPEMGSGVAA